MSSSTSSQSVSLAASVPFVASLDTEELREAASFGLLVDYVLVNILAERAWRLVSQTFRWREDDVLLVVKVVVQEAQYVVFVSRPTPTHCMRTLVRKLRSNEVALYPDKYA